MHQLRISASDGDILTGHLPSHWGEVPLKAYADLAAAAQPLPASVAGSSPTLAYLNEAACQALARLLGLPTAEPLLADRSLLLPLYQAAPFLFAGPLPDTSTVAERFTHLGTEYAYCGGVAKANGEQLEGLLSFLEAHEGHPLGCGPHLLAILYKPTGLTKQTTESVQAAAEAFATLPVSIAWPALQNFTLRFAPWENASRSYLAARLATEQVLSALEQAAHSPTSASPGRCSPMLRWLGRAWLKLVRKMLRTSLPLSPTTTTPPNSGNQGSPASSTPFPHPFSRN